MYNIAVIDDDPELLSMISKYLDRREEFNITTFNSAKEAFNELKTNKFDIILSDIIMDAMTGVEMLKEIKKFNPKQKIILMTSFSTEERIIICDNLEADDYITKPFISIRDVENKILDNLGL